MADSVAETLCFTKSSASEKQGQNRVDGSDLKSKHAVTPDTGRRVFAPAQSCNGFGEGDIFLLGSGGGWEGSFGKGGDKEVRRELLSVTLLRVY